MACPAFTATVFERSKSFVLEQVFLEDTLETLPSYSRMFSSYFLASFLGFQKTR